MYVRVDLSSRVIELVEPDNFMQFHVVASGQGLDDDVADALGDGGRRCATPSHVHVAIDLVRRLAAPQVTSDWASGFDKMLGFAQKMGWIDPTGAFIQAHTEWPTVDRGACADGDPRTLPPRPQPSPSGELPMRWLLYTSGTTSDPKGARHTDATNAIVARSTATRMDVRHGDRPSLVFPFPHIGGIMWMILSLQIGASLLFEEAFDARRTPRYLSREGCTHPGSGTPFHLAYLAVQREQPDVPLFPRAKCFPGGGAPKPPQLTYEVNDQLGAVVVSGWGLTEAPILTMCSTKDSLERLAQSEGFALPGVDLIVVKADGTRAAPGEEGELRAK